MKASDEQTHQDILRTATSCRTTTANRLMLGQSFERREIYETVLAFLNDRFTD